MIKRTTRRFKLIEEALHHLAAIERLEAKVEPLQAEIGPTPCALCEKDAGLDNFCFGCLDFICQVCQPVDRPEFIVAGPHTLEDHQEAKSEMQSVTTGSEKDTQE